MGNLEDKAEGLAGKAKEALGDATDNKDLENEGKADQVKSDVKEALTDAGDKVKDVANEVLGAFKKD